MERLNDGNLQGLVLSTGGLMVWALALYVLSRAPWRPATILAGTAMLCLAAYLTGEALGALATDPTTWADWLRRSWWASSIAAPAWLALTLTLVVDEGPETHATLTRRIAVVASAAALAIGAAFGVTGTFGNQAQDWRAAYTLSTADAPALGARHVHAGPLLPVFQLFVLVCLVWAAVNVIILWRISPPGSPLRVRWAWLCATAALFLLGGGWIVVASGIYFLVGLPGQILLIIGMLILGWNMARYGALLAGEQVLSDFIAYAAAMVAIVVLYGVLLLSLAPDYAWLERGIPLLLLVMTTHVVVDTRGHVLDRVLYAPLLSTLRGQLRELGNRVVRQPDELSALVDVRETVDQILRQRTAEVSTPASETASRRVLVEGALRHLNDLPALSEHPLLDELPILAGTPLERGTSLRNELELAIERLRPSGPRPTPGSSEVGGWLHYLVLREAYVDGRPNKQIMQRYALSEGTFHRARRRAIDAITADLTERAARAATVREADPSLRSG